MKEYFNKQNTMKHKNASFFKFAKGRELALRLICIYICEAT